MDRAGVAEHSDMHLAAADRDRMGGIVVAAEPQVVFSGGVRPSGRIGPPLRLQARRQAAAERLGRVVVVVAPGERAERRRLGKVGLPLQMPERASDGLNGFGTGTGR